MKFCIDKTLKCSQFVNFNAKSNCFVNSIYKEDRKDFQLVNSAPIPKKGVHFFDCQLVDFNISGFSIGIITERARKVREAYK